MVDNILGLARRFKSSLGDNQRMVPTFNDANDRHALNTLAEVFPRHRIVGIHCVDFIWGLGALHCMTQQQPAVE